MRADRTRRAGHAAWIGLGAGAAMQLIFLERDGAERELDVQVNDPSSTVADLLAALGGPAAQPTAALRVGDRHLAPADLDLVEAGLYEGAVVRIADAPLAPAADGRGVAQLLVLGGPDAGRILALPAGQYIAGRDHARADVVIDVPTVSRRHCQLAVAPTGGVSVTDVGSTSGTWVEGARTTGTVELRPGIIAELGTVPVTVGEPRRNDRPAVDPLRHAGVRGTIPFNRPPRAAAPPEPPPLAAPTAPRQREKAIFSIASIIAPLGLAAVMVVALQNISFALLALFSPLMMIANWYETAFRSKRSLRRETREYQTALARFRDEVELRRRTETGRRRDAQPDLAEVLRRATEPSIRLWERRTDHADFLRLSIGLADLPWRPSLVDERERPSEEVSQTLTEFGTLPLVPVLAELARGGVVGITGDRDIALALARALLCQATTNQGPADLSVAVFAASEHADAWDWVKWLPHTRNARGSGGERLLAGTADESEALLGVLLAQVEGRPQGPTTLGMFDDESLLTGRQSPARALLRGVGGPAAGIVIAGSPDRLPALCSAVVQITGRDGSATLQRPQVGEQVDDFIIGGLSEPTARGCARALARFEDPELRIAGAGLPDSIGLLPLLRLENLDADAVLQRWRGQGEDAGAASPLGVSDTGTFPVDLVRDGPHCLVGGTTGSGKSELLRTLVAGLAVSADPDHLTFVLIDYKGGASFDECSRLPHAVGLVTDLDAQLGERALRCLEAELRYRERLLREAGALDLPDYLRRQARARGGAAGGGLERPLPRLVVVIDEFATMVKELPDFIDSLVGIAQRGRSLGVHLILATQKPSGAVNDNIRTNTRLRIALRVEDKQDSLDVIDVPDAAAIVRRGRACVRRGPGDVALIQTALVTGVSGDESTARVDVAPFRFGPTARPPAPPRPADPSRRSDLGRLVDAVGAAFAALGADPPRRPWPEPLPTHLDLDTVCPRQPAAATNSLPATVPFALADDPEAQDQYPRGWEPGRGNMLVYGVVGSGATTTLAAIAMVLARTCSADRVHLHVLDFGAGELQPLARLPHTGAVVGATERERQMRLVQYLRTELDRRKELRGPARSDEPALVVLIDNYGAFTADFEAAAGNEVLEAFMRVYADGPEVGIHMVVSADRTGAVPGALTTLTQQKLLLRLSDPNDYGVFGVRPRQVPAFHPGRGVLAETAQVLQVARPVPGLAEAVDDVATWQPRPARPPVAIGVLPDDVSVVDLVGRAQIDGTRWFVPVGVGESDLATAGLTFYEGDHALVAGPARSGKSTVLVSLARVVKSSSPGVMTIGVALRRSPLRDSPDLDRLVTTPAELAEALQGVDGDHRPQLILIDDADSVDDENGALASLLARGRPDVHIVASGRSDALRSLYGHWIQIIGRSRLGLLLRPDPDLDGTLLSTNLPRRQRVAPRAGRGYLVDSSGRVELVQAART